MSTVYYKHFYRGRDGDTSSATTSTAQAEGGSAGPLHAIPYLLIRTELCGKTLKHWLENHKKRKRERLLSYFEQVRVGTIKHN